MTMIFILILAFIIPLSLVFWLANVLSYMLSSFQEPWQMISPTRWVLAIIIPLIMMQWGLKRKSLSDSGACMGFVVGFVLTLSNLSFLASLFVFFVTASKATKFRAHMKRKLEEEFKEGGQRNWIQVLCNGGVATEFAILYMIDRGSGECTIDFTKHYTQSWLCMAVLGALCCSNGDTYASEIGTVIGRWDPRLITTFRKVPKGTNGAVSFIGLVSSAVGGLVVGLAYYGMLLATISTETMETSPPQWPLVVMAAAAGFIGSLVDSYLGATVQYSGYHEEKHTVVEQPGPNVKHISGVAILDNHSVNLMANIIMAIVTPNLAFYLWGYVS